jgi:hypothetical protein
MFKIFAVATLLSGITALATVPGFDASISLQNFVKDARFNISKASRLPSTAAIGVRNYVSPRLNGNRVAFCLSGQGRCGKEAADAFCRSNGFREALTFQRSGILRRATTLSFGQIKCWNPTEIAEVTKAIVGTWENANLTIMIKNRAFPLKSQMTMEPCSRERCVEI